MLKENLWVSRILSQILQAEADELCEELHELADEDDFSSQFAARVKKAIDGRQIGNVNCRAQMIKTKWRGKHSEESIFGTDLILSLHLKEGALEEHKAYLIQAKVNDGSYHFPNIRTDHLKEQVEDMLAVTPESYVWAYAEDGVGIYRAGTMGAAVAVGVEDEVVPLSVGAFFGRAIRCQNGDYNLGRRALAGLRSLAEQLRADALAIALATDEQDPPTPEI